MAGKVWITSYGGETANRYLISFLVQVLALVEKRFIVEEIVIKLTKNVFIRNEMVNDGRP